MSCSLGPSTTQVAVDHLGALVDRSDLAALAWKPLKLTTPAGWVAGCNAIIENLPMTGPRSQVSPLVPFLTMKMATKPSYTLAWIARGWLKSCMWRRGTSSLRKVNDTSLAEFARSLPDEKRMFESMVGTRGWQQPLSKFFQSTGYQGLWELCTMVWCFCGNAVFDHIPSCDLEREEKALSALRVQQKRKLCHNMTPAQLVGHHFNIIVDHEHEDEE